MGNLTVINVKSDYGAHGDGVHDDTTAINNALAAVPTLPSIGAIVYFPAGAYLISAPLVRQVNFTRCVGEGKSSTTILVNSADWANFVSPVNPSLGFVFDIASTSLTDCAVMDMTINGSAGSMDNPTLGFAGGVYCTAREHVDRVFFHDIWGWAVWLTPDGSDSRIIDCDADLGEDSDNNAGNDCIGGDPIRSSIVRFYWFSTMKKATALDVACADGGTASISLYDCNNESEKDILLEGCTQSVIIGCRFNNPDSGNELWIRSDCFYTKHKSITNPSEIIVAECIFANATCKVHFEGGDNGTYTQETTLTGGRVAIVNNSFDGNPYSPIQWAGDDVSTSVGGSVIAGNRIIGANQSGSTTPQTIFDAVGNSLGTLYGSGISILSSYGLVIDHNTIEDTAAPNMLYSMQLARQDKVQPGQTQRIVVQGNLCGYAPGAGNGSVATFYLPVYTTAAANPLPILLKNTNQFVGYDSIASGTVTSGVAWPTSEGYPYDAVVTVAGSASSIKIGTEATALLNGSFYVPAGQTITITWSTLPIIRIFAS
jgi:hypothetical protein